MSTIIAHNLSAMNTQRNLYASNRGLSKSMEKLSSGYRINVGADGPADLVISEQLRAQQFAIERAVRNTTEATNVIAIAEGALNEMNNILKKMKALAIHAANSGVTSPQQVAADQSEMDSSVQTLDRIANTTKFSDQQLLNGAKQLTFEQKTTIKGTQQNRLINNAASAFDQIFRKNDYSIGITFNGVKTSDDKTWMGEADLAKQAAKAYLEIDTAVGTKSHVTSTGNLTEDNQFILTGNKGSRNFKFDIGTHVGEIVQQIHTTSASTGVDAALVFNSAQTVDVCYKSGAAGNIVPDVSFGQTGLAQADWGDLSALPGVGGVTLGGVTVVDGVTGAVDKKGKVDFLVDTSAWSVASQAKLKSDDLGRLNNYSFEFSQGVAGKVRVDVYYDCDDALGGMGAKTLLGSIELDVDPANNVNSGPDFVTDTLGGTTAAPAFGALVTDQLGGHLEGVVLNFNVTDTLGFANPVVNAASFGAQATYVYGPAITTDFPLDPDHASTKAVKWELDPQTGEVISYDKDGARVHPTTPASAVNDFAVLKNVYDGSGDPILAGIYGQLHEDALALLNEGTTQFEFKFEERTIGGVKGAYLVLYTNNIDGNGARTEKLVPLSQLFDTIDLSTVFDTDLVKGLQFTGNLVSIAFTTDISKDGTAAGTPVADTTNWEYLKNKTLFATSVRTVSVPGTAVNIDLKLVARSTADVLGTANHVGNAVDPAGGPRALGEFNIFGNQAGAVRSASDSNGVGLTGVQFGRNTDGQGRIYVKFTSNGSFELYKDASYSLESMVGSGVSGKPVSEVNNSGLGGLVLTLDPSAAPDLSQLKGVYIAVGGIEGENGVFYGANTEGSNLAGDGSTGSASFDKSKTFLSGVSLGTNTDPTGNIFTRTTVVGYAIDTLGNMVEQIQVSAYRDQNCRAEDLVAQSEVTTVGANGATILLNEIRNRDNTSGTGLAIALSCNGRAFSGVEKGLTMAGTISFNNLAARVFSSDYGSDAFVKIEQHMGGIFTYYENPGDFDSSRLIEARQNNPVTMQFDGQDATLSVNGSQVMTRGLELNLATQDIQARLQFYSGYAGTTTIAQVGYGEGSIFTKIGALNLISDKDTDPNVDRRFANLSGLLCNAGHITMENIGGWRNGMVLQLGEGDGDQNRTVLSIQDMAVANMGKVTRLGYWETGLAVMTEKTFTMQDVMGGGYASLLVDPVLAMSIIEQAISDVSDLRARLGAAQLNLLETNANNLRVAIENIAKTESNIRDTDMAAEMINFTKDQILQSAGMTMLAQANAVQQGVLQLLK